MALDTELRHAAADAAEALARAQERAGLVEARCRRTECLNLMFEFRPVPNFYIRGKCRKCGHWNIFTETPG